VTVRPTAFVCTALAAPPGPRVSPEPPIRCARSTPTSRRFRAQRKAAKLAAPLPTIHSLRHSAATWWLASGLTVHAVAELLGHSDPTLVIRRYGYALPAERSAAGERLEAFLASSAPIP
jgi:integrase